MQFLKDLPQTTQLSIALVLILLPVLAAIVLNRKKNAAATPADAASRKERRRRGARTTPQKLPRRSRRNLADESAQQLGGQVGGQLDADDDVDLIITPEDAEAPEGITLTSAPLPAPDVTRDPHNALVSDTPPADDNDGEAVIGEMTEPQDVPVAVVDDPYVTVAPPLPVGASVAQPGWPSPGELASGFDPDAFDPLPPAAPAAHAEVDMQMTDIDSGEAWLDENLTATQTTSVPDEARDSADTQIIQVPAVDWDDDDDFDPATGWSDDGSDVTPPVLAIDEDEQPDWVVPTSGADDLDELGDATDEELPLEAPSDDLDDEKITVTVSALDEAGEITDWDEDEAPLTTVAWDAPDTDDSFDDEPIPADDEPTAVPDATWTDDDEGDDEAWADAEWSDDPQEVAMAAPLAVPFPPPGTLPAHEQVATLSVPFPVPGTLPSHEETAVQVFTERDRQPGSLFTVNGTRPQMPAITGRVDGGAPTPVVIDLAKLVANGERVEMVIEQDVSGHGVRLRFGPTDASTPTDEDSHDRAEPVDAERADEQAEPDASENADMTAIAEVTIDEAADVADAVPADGVDPATTPGVPANAVILARSTASAATVAPESVDIPFLTGGPRSATHQGPDETVAAPATQSVDPPDEVVAPATGAVAVAGVAEAAVSDAVGVPDPIHDAPVAQSTAPDVVTVPDPVADAPVAERTAPDTVRFDDAIDEAKVADVLASYKDEASHLYDAEPEPVAPVPVGVSSLSDDDPGKILADIRARLAALDERRTGADFDM